MGHDAGAARRRKRTHSDVGPDRGRDRAPQRLVQPLVAMRRRVGREEVVTTAGHVAADRRVSTGRGQHKDELLVRAAEARRGAIPR